MKIQDSTPELQINQSPSNSLGALSPFPQKQNTGCVIDLPTQRSANLRLSLVSSGRTAKIFQHLPPAEDSYELRKKAEYETATK